MGFEYDEKNGKLTHKPTLGTAPYWTRACERINELCDAIARFNNSSGKPRYDKMREWAKEIELQCDLLEQLEYFYK